MISNTPPAEALVAMTSGVTRVLRRAEIYEADGETLWIPVNSDSSSRLISGNVNLDYGRDERRILELKLDNSDGALDLETSNGFWYDNIIKVYRGIRYPVTPIAPHYSAFDEWETQIGEFMIDKIVGGTSDSFMNVSGRDYTKKCLLSKLERSMTFEAGTYIYELIRNLAANCGISKIKIPFTNETLPLALDLERGTERWKVMKDAANSNSYDLYFDNQGYLTMSKYADPALSPSVATFSSGEDGNLVKYEKSADDSRLYNHIVITGNRESVEGGEIGLPYFGEAKNEDPNSPTSIAKIGDRAFFYDSSFFTDDSQCAELALSWLKAYSLESYDINWSAIQYPWLEVGTVTEIFEPKKNDSTRFLLDTLNYSLSLEPMTATGKRVLAVS